MTWTMHRQGKVRTRHWRALLAPFLAAAMACGLAACGDEESAGPEEGVDVEDIRQDDLADDGDIVVEEEVDPDSVELDFAAEEDLATFTADEALLGARVTVSAEVADILGPSVLTIAGEGGPEPVLVVAQSADVVPAATSDNAVLQVTGTVRDMITVETFEDFETEYEEDGPFEFEVDDEEFFGSAELDPFEGDRFLIASSIEVLDPAEDE